MQSDHFTTMFNTTTSNGSIDFVRSFGVLSNNQLFWIQMIVAVGISSALSVFGIFANIINIIVFFRQGILGDSSTVSFAGLAVADLLSLVWLLWLAVCYVIIHFRPPGLPYDPFDVTFLTGGRQKVLITTVTRWMTAYLSTERCFCVPFPFKARKWFSPPKTAVIIPCIYLAVLIYYLPLNATYYLKWKFDPNTNTTILKGHLGEGAGVVDMFVAYTHGLSAQILNMSIATISTLILAICVNKSRKWRKSTATSGNQESKTENTDKHVTSQSDKATKSQEKIRSKDEKLIMMATVICIIFLICFTPEIAFVLTEKIVPEIMIGRRYHNLFFVLYACSFFLEAINSCVNIFVYYNMSSRFRKEVNILFGWNKPKS